MEAFDQQEVQRCIALLGKAQTPDDAVMAWYFLQGRYPDLVGLVCLESYNGRALPYPIKKYMKPPFNYLSPYFETENIYFLEDDLLREMFSNDKIDFGIDYTLMLDTNIASYVDKLVRGESLKHMHGKIVPFIDELLHDDLNFDCLFYLLENVKTVKNLPFRNQTSKISFWKSLKKEFRYNLVSLQIFQSIDTKEYKQTSNPKPTFTYRHAARVAIEFAFDFYASEHGKRHTSAFTLLQRLILLNLIGMVKTQLSSNKSAKSKTQDHFNYVHEIVGAYFEREAIIAHKYFLDRRSVKMLEKIHKGMPVKGLLKKLDNIAWDMAAPRFMEHLISAERSIDKGRFFIPMFVSFDSNLRDLLSLYPVKGAIYSKSQGTLIPIPKTNTLDYFQSYDCDKYLLHLYSDALKSERSSRERPTRASVHTHIKNQYKELRNLITSKPKA